MLEQTDIKLNLHNKTSLTALSLAAYEGHAEVVKLLLEQPGVKLNLQDHRGVTTLFC